MVATAVFRFTDADMALSGKFFVEGASEHWPGGEAYPWKELYDWGVLPAWILGCGGLLIWIVSFVWLKLEPWRDTGLYFCLLLVLGPGLLVNGVLKPHWGRPRPNNVKQFEASKVLAGLGVGTRAGRSVLSQRPCLDGLLPHGAGLCVLSPSASAGLGVLAARTH